MASSTPYSRIDRALHRLAYGSSILQDVLADIEESLFSKTWQDAQARKPIFITSLPRAGTTIVLEALHRLPGLATHTYRDMPFILTPVLWNKLSRGIRSKGVLRERAHNDGLVVSEDSPEAFEEVLWRKFLPGNYSDQGIALWNSTNTKYTNYFHQHMQKIVSLRQPHNMTNSRYASKNNGNIARIKAIKTMFPDASIIVPLRNPSEHAISLWRQHKNFLEQHAGDDFVRKYMADIGHYEFGVLHRPIQFPKLKSLVAGLNPESLDYWIAYWIAAFEYLVEQEGIRFISYENLCESPEQGLKKLCQHLELLVQAEEIVTASSIFKAPPASRKLEHPSDQTLTKRANILYQRLLPLCLLNN